MTTIMQPVRTNRHPRERRLTLSFDNGPHPDTTPRVIEILKERGILSSFFAVGRQLADCDNVALSRKAHENGHWLGNHTYSHRPALGERYEANTAETEIAATQALLADLAHPAKLFRPSGGGGNLDKRLLNPECLAYLQAHRYSCVLWTTVPGDLAGRDWVANALAAIEAQPWTLLVLHDVPGGAVPRLEEFLDAIEKRGQVEIMQSFPDTCVPMIQGWIRLPMDQYVRDEVA